MMISEQTSSSPQGLCCKNVGDMLNSALFKKSRGVFYHEQYESIQMAVLAT